MSVLSWDDSYSVGVKKIDHDHQILIALINKTYVAAQSQQDADVLLQLATGMIDYMERHFSTEEELMQAYHYPEAAGHLEMHEDFRQYSEQVLDTKTDTISSIKYLSDWFNGHILGTDKKLGRFLNNQGIH